MKKILIGILVVFMVAGLVACGPPPMQAQNDDNMSEAQENMAEQIAEDMMGNEVDVDIDDDNGGVSVDISSEEGDLQIQGNEDGIPWPSDKMPANVPEPKGVKCIGTMDMGVGVMVSFEGGDANMAKAYVQEMKAAGWEINMEMEAEGVFTVVASNEKGEGLSFGFSDEDKQGTVQYSAAQ